MTELRSDLEAARGPVKCFGQMFPTEDARREYFLALLAEKLRDPEFRRQDGFPNGSDEAILAMSDPPYYTACPNPWLADFITQYGRPYDLQEEYSREPLAIDVSEGKTDALYKAHAYHTKVPHLAIVPSILHYTRPRGCRARWLCRVRYDRRGYAVVRLRADCISPHVGNGAEKGRAYSTNGVHVAQSSTTFRPPQPSSPRT